MHSSQPLDAWYGRLIGDNQRYRIEQHLGGGGMGDVFLATDMSLGGRVALKLLKEKLAIGELRKRFEREVAVCVALRSEHIVQVSDYGVTPEGYPFYVMEYLNGQTLRQLLRSEPLLSVERAVQIVVQVCDGLNLAHRGVILSASGTHDTRGRNGDQVKIVHRDLKPDNIFLVPTALGELVKILDFGIAKLRSEQPEHTIATTMFLGTYRYAAPEQLEIEQDLDERADIYSLGMILYEMLSGTDPFGLGMSPTPVSGVTWAVAHCSKPPIPLRQQPGCADISPSLEAIVMRCLHKSPSDRFSSVNELQRALRAAIHLPLDSSSETDATRLVVTADTTAHINATDWGTTGLGTTDLGTSSITSATQDLTPTVLRAEYKTVFDSPVNRFKLFRNPVSLVVVVGLTAVCLGFGVHYVSQSSTVSGLFPEAIAEGAGASEDLEHSGNPDRSPVQSAPMAGITSGSASGAIEVSSALVKSLAGHSDTVWAVALAPDDQTIVSGGFDASIKLWDLPTGTHRTLLGHSDAVRSVAITPNGKTLVSGSSDTTIKLWDLPTRELLQTLSGHSGPIWSVAVSADGQTIASGSYDGTVRVWDLPTGQLIHTLPEHYDSVWSVAISPDGETLVSGSYDGTAKIWNLRTGELIRSLSRHSEPVRSVAISPNGQLLATASWDKTVKIWNLQTGELVHTLEGHSDRVISVAFSPSGEMLASGSLDRTINLWNLAAGTHHQTLFGHSDWVVAVAFGLNGKTLVSGSKDQTVNLWRW
ncbi:WD40 repeat domain-containing serine/threonine protein kinase [Egbenema bharatensis]|uniref:WD40 repeat domain-containing serine/threonine protein kinase n=1 Tax=Egbenema bharatensis TaxID=3463334 RepID=UPI003A8BE55E